MSPPFDNDRCVEHGKPWDDPTHECYDDPDALDPDWVEDQGMPLSEEGIPVFPRRDGGAPIRELLLGLEGILGVGRGEAWHIIRASTREGYTFR